MVMPKRATMVLLAGAVAILPHAARSADLTVLVEEVSGVAGVGEFEYLGTGRTVNLGANGTLVLSYLETCLRERIVGGTVTIGANESTVRGGRVQREDLRCDKGALRLSDNQATSSGAFALRSLPGENAKPEIVVHALSPVFEVAGTGRMTIERVDRRGTPVANLDLVARNALRPGLYDAAKAGVTLAAGGVYRAKVGEQAIVFEVEGDTKDRTGPLLGRLIRF
jgi:hypothetical protein